MSSHPELHSKPDRIRPLSETHSEIRFTADQALLDDLEKLRGLLAHKNPHLSMAELIQEIARIALQKLDPTRKPTRSKEASESALSPQLMTGRMKDLPPTSEVTESAPAIGSAVTKISALAIAPIRPSARSRYIPTPIKREVYRRDQGQCTFKSPDGRRCESRFLLEYDHITPFAQGGPTKSGNLRLRRQTHNLLYAEMIFGKSKTRGRNETSS